MKKITAFALFAPLALAACGGSSSSTAKTAALASSSNANASSTSTGGGAYGSSGSSKKTSATASAASGAASVSMLDNYFGTKTISGKPGATIKVHLTNKGKNQHNFQIAGQKASDADVAPGKSATVTVKIPKSGSVQFFCEYHKGLGMVGKVKAS